MPRRASGTWREVIEALRLIQQSRDALAEDIRALVKHTDELRKMSSDVESIAFQTNMLALNAAIRLRTPGAAGKGFAVVAHEVRALSEAARTTGKRITSTVGVISGALLEIGAKNEKVSSRDQQAVADSQEHIRTVLERFTQRTTSLAAAAQQSQRAGEAIKGEVCESFVQLQFQDRVGQILQHVIGSMEQVERARRSAAATPPSRFACRWKAWHGPIRRMSSASSIAGWKLKRPSRKKLRFSRQVSAHGEESYDCG